MANHQKLNSHSTPVLHGASLIIAAVVLAISNFIVVLDITIANVSVSHIAGGLAISTTEGTYVITSYAVAEAIVVPLTGWLSKRFGTLRVFTTCVVLFGFFSFVCGFASSLGMLVAGRVCQGLVGGPLMPLTQTLLMQIFPPQKRGMALGLWSITTLVAPVMGPIVGGYICDNWGWSYIFYINIPVAIFCGLSARKLLADYETEILREKIDFGGLALLIVWVAALQFMLDEGKNYDWFESNFICMLLIIAVLGFIAFLIWELTQDKPIVDLSVFRHRGYFASVFTISLTFGAYFGSIVLTPLWLQNYMGYTATWSGCATAATGVLAVISAGFAAKFSQKFDLRKLVFCGVVWLGVLTFIRSFGNTDMTYFDIAVPMLIQGVGLPFFFVPLTGLALSSVNPNETASAAGLMNFLRTLSGAVATSIVTTAWEDNTNLFRSELVGKIESPKTVAALLGNENLGQQSVGILDQLVQTQAVMLATNRLFLLSACAFIFAASVIWIAKKPAQKADTSSAH